jgi:hypothetical protein
MSTLLLLSLGKATAQTNANGPYYAWPSWDQTLPSSTRFIVLSNFNSQAVLDRETGLVWERSPSTTAVPGFTSIDCNNKTVGNRRGWRLPTIQELMSLIDPTQSSPALPSGHPFQIQNVSGAYWSATILDVSDGTSPSAWIMGLAIGNAIFGTKTTNGLFIWCVRGGQGVDRQ